MRTSKSFLNPDLAIAKELVPSLVFGRTQRQAEEWESFTVKKAVGFSSALIRDCCLREAGGGPEYLNAAQTTYWLVEHNWLFLVGPNL